MTIDVVVRQAQEHLREAGIDGWLLYDYRDMNPIFWDTVGHISNVTRPCWLWIPSQGEPRFLVSYVDQGRFAHLGVATTLFVSREDMRDRLVDLLSGAGRIAMEYSHLGELPRVSRVDAGTVELVAGLGVEIVSSADTVQFATQRWSDAKLRSHLVAAGKLDAIVQEAFGHIEQTLGSGLTELEVAEFIRRRFQEEGLEAADGPVVAVNDHSSDPHFDPTPENAVAVKPGDWLLVDLWARPAGEGTMYADITWVAYVGDTVPALHQRVFDTVIGARDAAVDALSEAFDTGRVLQGWELDRVARDHIERAGYGDHFNHRLGHSLGSEVHGNAVNLDGWETHDTRRVIPGLAVTIEPGVYLPEFGVRSEIDVYVSEDGPLVTTEVQRSVVLIGG